MPLHKGKYTCPLDPKNYITLLSDFNKLLEILIMHRSLVEVRIWDFKFAKVEVCREGCSCVHIATVAYLDVARAFDAG